MEISPGAKRTSTAVVTTYYQCGFVVVMIKYMRHFS